MHRVNNHSECSGLLTAAAVTLIDVFTAALPASATEAAESGAARTEALASEDSVRNAAGSSAQLEIGGNTVFAAIAFIIVLVVVFRKIKSDREKQQNRVIVHVAAPQARRRPVIRWLILAAAVAGVLAQSDGSFSRTDLEAEISRSYETRNGQRPTSVTCPSIFPQQPGATIECRIEAPEQPTVSAEVEIVDDGYRINWP
ncbi:DUF4333 domain-containing protein [Glycomyces salinus]|uniref:DUF4333 domain-containing protein n=1 Tax=Glycomyces salinus TaxID=980294 RepID=UPI0018ED4177|nr:DUF4333 domain-containing protein [Glycomyces salinus]